MLTCNFHLGSFIAIWIPVICRLFYVYCTLSRRQCFAQRKFSIILCCSQMLGKFSFWHCSKYKTNSGNNLFLSNTMQDVNQQIQGQKQRQVFCHNCLLIPLSFGRSRLYPWRQNGGLMFGPHLLCFTQTFVVRSARLPWACVDTVSAVLMQTSLQSGVRTDQLLLFLIRSARSEMDFVHSIYV